MSKHLGTLWLQTNDLKIDNKIGDDIKQLSVIIVKLKESVEKTPTYLCADHIYLSVCN